jgi:hypothetical protein
MASAVLGQPRAAPSERFVAYIAVAMAITVVCGFSVQFLLGLSTFASRPLVHVHAFVFMSWVGLFVVQSWLGTRGPIAIHRRLGWVGAVWTLALVIMGCWITVDAVQLGRAPFFFQPQIVLIGNPLFVLSFAGLTAAAIAFRRRTDWHKRLHICALAAIMGPAFGRLLPMPLFIPHAYEAAQLAGLVFPLVGALGDRLRSGRAHPAWWCGIATVIAALILTRGIAASAVGDDIYRSVTKGTVGESVPGLAFPAPPGAR